MATGVRDYFKASTDKVPCKVVAILSNETLMKNNAPLVEHVRSSEKAKDEQRERKVNRPVTAAAFSESLLSINFVSQLMQHRLKFTFSDMKMIPG